jgi:NTE family protein
MTTASHKIGLSLSGGGYRATAFHLGTLNKLQEMGILNKVDVISTISGGSITGAYYCLEKDNYAQFSSRLYEGLQQKSVIQQIFLSGTFLQLILFVLLLLGPAFYFLFSGKPWLFLFLLISFFFLLLKFQFRIFPVSKRIEKIYDAFFYQGKKLGQLPDRPTLVIGSTNLQTARAFTFSRNWMQDSTYQYMDPPVKFHAEDFPIARAVMASSCVPFAFTPIKIDAHFFRVAADADRVHPLLVDGGVYDNQGIHKIVQKGSYACSHIITSDAGGGSAGELSFRNTISLLITTVDVFMARIKKVQMVQDVYNNAATAKREIAYFSLSWDVENCIPGFVDNMKSQQVPATVLQAHGLKTAWIEEPELFRNEIETHLRQKTGYAKIEKPTVAEKKTARGVGTNLAKLSKLQVDCLMKQAGCLTELQVKLYCPGIMEDGE